MTDRLHGETIRAEDARTPHDPRLTAFEAGRWYALHDRALPAGATQDARDGYWVAQDVPRCTYPRCTRDAGHTGQHFLG